MICRGFYRTHSQGGFQQPVDSCACARVVQFNMALKRRSPLTKKKPNPLLWIAEPLMELPSYIEKPMFGCTAIYLHGRLCLVLASGEEPWNGILIPTNREHHDAISAAFSHVEQHPILKKWLYLPEASETFESDAAGIVDSVRMNDQRFGVEPKERKPRGNPLKKKRTLRQPK